MATASPLLLAEELPSGNGPPRPLEGASFLLEDANNQEEGVVEHVLTFARTSDSAGYALCYGQEWPVGGVEDQLSVQVPWLRSADSGGAGGGLGDVVVGYRRQLGSGERRWVASPRLSVSAPTRDRRRGQGSGGAGVQVGFPLTTRVGSGLVVHTNLSLAVPLGAGATEGTPRELLVLAAGQGIVWNLHPRVNVTVETVWTGARLRAAEGGPHPSWRSSWVVSPGVQVAVDLPGGIQVVPGVAFPVGAGPSRGERGVVLFLGFQHGFEKSPAAER